jgi:hypothetical protein
MKKIAEHPLKRQILRDYSAMRKNNEMKLMENFKQQGVIMNDLVPKMQEQTERADSEDVVLQEKLGALLQTISFSDLELTPADERYSFNRAKYTDGSEAPFFSHTHEHNGAMGEANLSLAIGQFCGVVYPQGAGKETTNFSSTESCVMYKEILLDQPFDNDVYIKSYAYVFIPGSLDKIHAAERGNAIADFCGATLNVNTSIGYYTTTLNNSYSKSSPSFEMLNSLRSEATNYTTFQPFTFVPLEAHLRLPAGKRNIAFGLHTDAVVFSSTDFSQFPADSSLHGFSFIDLRNRLTGNQWPLMRNTLTGSEKKPEGGVRTLVQLDIYAIENSLSM